MTRTTYEQFDAAFSRVSAYAIFQRARFVGRVAIKYPADGAGRLQCFAQVWGGPMSRGTASGGGYDKATAAAYRAVQALAPSDTDADQAATVAAIKAALSSDGGERWTRQLEAGGFTVAHVIDG